MKASLLAANECNFKYIIFSDFYFTGYTRFSHLKSHPFSLERKENIKKVESAYCEL